MLYVLLVPACATLFFGVVITCIGIARWFKARKVSGYFGPERRTQRVLPIITYGE